jgi:hypothetical protein
MKYCSFKVIVIRRSASTHDDVYRSIFYALGTMKKCLTKEWVPNMCGGGHGDHGRKVTKPMSTRL